MRKRNMFRVVLVALVFVLAAPTMAFAASDSNHFRFPISLRGYSSIYQTTSYTDHGCKMRVHSVTITASADSNYEDSGPAITIADANVYTGKRLLQDTTNIRILKDKAGQIKFVIHVGLTLRHGRDLTVRIDGMKAYIDHYFDTRFKRFYNVTRNSC